MKRSPTWFFWLLATMLVAAVAFPVLAVLFGDPTSSWGLRIMSATLGFNMAVLAASGVLVQLLLVLFFIVIVIALAQLVRESAKDAGSSSASRVVEQAKSESPEESYRILKLEPNIYGIGLNLHELWKWVKGKLGS